MGKGIERRKQAGCRGRLNNTRKWCLDFCFCCQHVDFTAVQGSDSSSTAQHMLLANAAETLDVLGKVHYSIALRGQERLLQALWWEGQLLSQMSLFTELWHEGKEVFSCLNFFLDFQSTVNSSSPIKSLGANWVVTYFVNCFSEQIYILCFQRKRRNHLYMKWWVCIKSLLCKGVLWISYWEKVEGVLWF